MFAELAVPLKAIIRCEVNRVSAHMNAIAAFKVECAAFVRFEAREPRRGILLRRRHSS